MKMHRMLDNAHFETIRAERLSSNQKRIDWLSTGKGDAQACYGSLCRDSLILGYITLILRHNDDEARQHFHAAVEYAGKWLTAPGSMGAPRVYDVKREASDTGIRVTAIHEIPPPSAPRKLSPIDFGYILATTAAFGNRDAMNAVGTFPEAGHQNPDVIAGPSVFTHDRAWKAWIRGDETEARKEGLLYLKQSREVGPRAGMSAFLSMATSDANAFRKHIEEYLKAHRKHFQKYPNDAEGFVSLYGLALCRLAIDRGIPVEDGPYLPVRLLPNYPGAPKPH